MGFIPGRAAIGLPRSTSGVGKSSTGLVGWGAFTCVVWQVTLCDPIWQLTLGSSVMGFPLTAILGFNLLTFKYRVLCFTTVYRLWNAKYYVALCK